jgi:hypothetical protein
MPKGFLATQAGERVRSLRVAFGVSPNRVFRRDAGNCTRGRVRSPDLAAIASGLRKGWRGGEKKGATQMRNLPSPLSGA